MCDCAIRAYIHNRLRAECSAQPKVCHLGTEPSLISITVAQQDVAAGEISMQQVLAVQVC